MIHTAIWRMESRRRLRSALAWSLGMLALHLLFMPFFPSIAKEAALFDRLIAEYPPELLTAFGMNGINLATVLGYYSVIFSLVQLALGIQAATYGFGLLTQEENERTADFLLTRPVSRGRIWTSKVLAVFTCLLLTDALLALIAWGTIEAFRQAHTYDAGLLWRLLGTLPPLQLYFFSLAMALSVLLQRVRTPMYYGLGLGFGMYVFNALSSISGEAHLTRITPFYQFDTARLLRQGALDTQTLALSLTISLAALALSWIRYLRRDVAATS